MSLKAKLEAVIYAAEEPVTLAQLAALFAGDALEWKAEQEAARQEAEAAEISASAPLPFLNEQDGVVAEASGRPAADAQPDPDPAPQVQEADGPLEIPIEIPVVEGGDGSEAVSESGESASADDPEAEAKRQARLRDREVRVLLRQLLDELIESYASDSRGLEIREIAGGYRMATKPECHDAVRSFVKSLKPALKLSLPALETLAVIAYKQPVTAPEVNEIRGVDSSGVFGSLLARKLIATAGRKQVIGRPILYKTTKEFLLRFGLKDVAELPSMEEFEKMAAIELEETNLAESNLAEAEAAGEEPGGPEDTAPAIAADLNLELNPDSNHSSGQEPASPPPSAPEPEAAEAASTPTDTAPGGAE
jgi:segregation and condensation protein B